MITAAEERVAEHLRYLILLEEHYNNLWRHTAIRDNYPVVVPPISDERSDETDDEKKLTTYLLKQVTERQRIRKREEARTIIKEVVRTQKKIERIRPCVPVLRRKPSQRTKPPAGQ